eukprot:tig00021036_g17323.t1
MSANQALDDSPGQEDAEPVELGLAAPRRSGPGPGPRRGRRGSAESGGGGYSQSDSSSSFSSSASSSRPRAQQTRLLLSATARRDATGAVVGAIAVGQDVTEHRMRIEVEAANEARAPAARPLPLASPLWPHEHRPARAQTKNRFLAYTVHELRTPLNGVLGMSELLAETPLDEEQVDLVHSVRVSAEQLLVIVNDLLDGIEVAAHLPPLGVEGGPPLPCRVVGDPCRLKQIVTNLTYNGIKFTGRGHVIVRVHATRVDAARGEAEIRIEARPRLPLDFPARLLLLHVRDTGLGIDEGGLERIFQDYVQADASITRLYGGTGMGLAVSRKLAELMGGGVAVASRPGEGSVFTVELRLALPAEPQAGLKEEEEAEERAATASPAPAAAPAALPEDAEGREEEEEEEEGGDLAGFEAELLRAGRGYSQGQGRGPVDRGIPSLACWEASAGAGAGTGAGAGGSGSGNDAFSVAAPPGGSGFEFPPLHVYVPDQEVGRIVLEYAVSAGWSPALARLAGSPEDRSPSPAPGERSPAAAAAAAVVLCDASVPPDAAAALAGGLPTARVALVRLTSAVPSARRRRSRRSSGRSGGEGDEAAPAAALAACLSIPKPVRPHRLAAALRRALAALAPGPPPTASLATAEPAPPRPPPPPPLREDGPLDMAPLDIAAPAELKSSEPAAAAAAAATGDEGMIMSSAPATAVRGAPAEGAGVDGRGPAPRPASPISVLVVDDVDLNRRVCAAMLARASPPARVEQAAHGREAVEAVRGRAARGEPPFALVLMDMEMPVMDGLSATRAIRALEAEGVTGGPPSAIVARHLPPAPAPTSQALTANVLSASREECAAAGMDGFLAK